MVLESSVRQTLEGVTFTGAIFFRLVTRMVLQEQSAPASGHNELVLKREGLRSRSTKMRLDAD